MRLHARTISGVVKRDWLMSPWLLVAIAGWLMLTALGTMLAIPLFANVASPGLQCFPASACPTVTTTEWIPSVLSGAVLAAGGFGVVAGPILVIRHRAG